MNLSKRSVQLFLFLLMSILDVKVHASVFTDSPKDCFKSNEYPCAVKNLSLTQNLNVHFVSLTPGTIVKFGSSKQVTLVKGSVLAKGNGVTVSTLYTDLSIDGVALVNVNEELIKLESYQGLIKINSKHDIVAGMQTLLPGLNESGELIVEAPQPLHYERSIKLWDDMTLELLSDTDKLELKKQIQIVVSTTSDSYKKAVLRKIANHKKKLWLKKQSQIQRQKEIQEMNDLFKKKNYILQ